MSPILPRSPTALALGAALVVGASACDSDRATAPAAAEVSVFDARLADAFNGGLNVSLEDAATRLAPALGEELGAPELRTHLQDLARYLAAGDAARATGALQQANGVLARATSSPDAGAIGLVLDYTQGLLADVRR
jgi:hypothetical protein